MRVQAPCGLGGSAGDRRDDLAAIGHLDRRGLPRPQADRRGRHGRDLRGGAGGDGSTTSPQGDARSVRQRREPPSTFRSRGAARGFDPDGPYRAGARRRSGSRHRRAVHRDGAARGDHPFSRASAARAVRMGRRARGPRAGVARTRGRTRARHRAQGFEAGERLSRRIAARDTAFHGEAPRLRDREGRRGGVRIDRGRARHAHLDGSRANDHRHADRSRGRRVVVRALDLHDAHRAALLRHRGREVDPHRGRVARGRPRPTSRCNRTRDANRLRRSPAGRFRRLVRGLRGSCAGAALLRREGGVRFPRESACPDAEGDAVPVRDEASRAVRHAPRDAHHGDRDTSSVARVAQPRAHQRLREDEHGGWGYEGPTLVRHSARGRRLARRGDRDCSFRLARTRARFASRGPRSDYAPGRRPY